MEILSCPQDLCLVSGRQVCKSTVMAMDAAEYAVHNRNKTVLMISSVERQAFGLFEKCMDYIYRHYKNNIKYGVKKPTKSEVNFKNGSKILCLPTGMDGHGIRFLTVHRLYADEAHFIPEEVWRAVTPMLAITGGKQRLFSTPHGSSGYFYDCCQSPLFQVYHKSTEEMVEEREIGQTWSMEQRNSAKDYLARERARMTNLQYAQEYLGRFVNELRQVFSDETIKKAMVLKRRGTIYTGHR